MNQLLLVNELFVFYSEDKVDNCFLDVYYRNFQFWKMRILKSQVNAEKILCILVNMCMIKSVTLLDAWWKA